VTSTSTGRGADGQLADGESFIRLGDRVAYWQGDIDRHEQTNVGIVQTDDAVVVIDANFLEPAQRINASITDRDGMRISHVVNTHYHADHSLGNPVFVDAGATVIGAAGQRAELLAKGREDAIQQVGEAPPRLYPAMLEFSESLTFGDSGLELVAVGPAHSGADLIGWLPDDRVLFAGDLAVAWDHGNNFSDPDADIEGWIGALARCIELNPRVVVPGHGRLSDAGVLDQQLSFIVELWQRALDVATGGVAEDALTSDSAVAGFVDRHAGHAVNAMRFSGMARSMLAVARKKCAEPQ
jgi:glyoxylase-like metal-dependent hydrolase (beta-lactamase superfamily II)